MILALAKAIDNLCSPDRSNLSQQSGGQRSPLSVYAYAVGINLCQLYIRLRLSLSFQGQLLLPQRPSFSAPL